MGGIALIVAALAWSASPAWAGATLAQAVESGSIQSMSVDEVWTTAQKWRLAILGGAAVLVFAFLLASGLMRPGGFQKAGLRDITPIAWPIWVFAALVVFFAAASAGVVLDQIGAYRNAELSEDQRLVAHLGAASLLGGVAGFGMLSIMSLSTKDGGLRVGFLDAPVGLGCYALAFPIVSLAAIGGVALHVQLSNGQAPPEIAHPTLSTLVSWWETSPRDPWLWGLIAGVVIGVPVMEELIYRVFLQSAALRVVKSPWVAIVLTAAVFALMHQVGKAEERVPWHALVPIFALGVCCGVAFERTKRAGVPIVMHACFNGMNVVLALVSEPTSATPAV